MKAGERDMIAELDLLIANGDALEARLQHLAEQGEALRAEKAEADRRMDALRDELRALWTKAASPRP